MHLLQPVYGTFLGYLWNVSRPFRWDPKGWYGIMISIPLEIMEVFPWGFFRAQYGGCHQWRYPKMLAWFHGKNANKIDDLGVSLFQETSPWDNPPESDSHHSNKRKNSEVVIKFTQIYWWIIYAMIPVIPMIALLSYVYCYHEIMKSMTKLLSKKHILKS